jgi:hypothetical protein
MDFQIIRNNYLQVVRTKAVAAWNGMGMAPIFGEDPVPQTDISTAKGDTSSHPVTPTPDAPQVPVTDVSDTFVDTTPQTVPAASHSAIDSLMDQARKQGHE